MTAGQWPRVRNRQRPLSRNDQRALRIGTSRTEPGIGCPQGRPCRRAEERSGMGGGEARLND
jgi:hypothetical protein